MALIIKAMALQRSQFENFAAYGDQPHTCDEENSANYW